LDFYKKIDTGLNRQVALMGEKNISATDLKTTATVLRQMESVWTESLIRR
jgi:hypothetical protein